MESVGIKPLLRAGAFEREKKKGEEEGFECNNLGLAQRDVSMFYWRPLEEVFRRDC